MLDDGRLTDGQGRTVDFRNTVVIMTSNLGSDLIQGNKDESYSEMKSLSDVSGKPTFPPRIYQSY